MSDLESLRGRVAIVTGAGQGTGGVGRAIALLLAARGAHVLVTDIASSVEQTATEIVAATSAQVLHVVSDLSHEAGANEVIDRAVERWGRLDILVNNAGGGIIRPFLEHTPQTLRETVDRNLWTAIWCSYFALPHMRKQSFGRIVNIGADSVRNGLWDHAGYNAAKGGVHGMTTGLAREFAAQDITVNTVAPCVVDSERLRTRMQEQPELTGKVLGIVPKGRAVKASEIASLVAYLASEDAAFITGQVVSINGGSTML
ncbi:Short-chain dehydrogenase/reductase SDR [Caballeronia udeis]|uniref:Short-chain dehydrogenase/reductase SDR n=1 Tax=Caballeronia udeis TaxID=1232866 RepID=A0A158JIJ6_9BURK|nr:SDR family oxidoreductase [Caballeronia udeis]SAL68666.1 Short-chain dehydrogenase/reductase SDR [Caballeronia udeis]